MIGQRRFLTLMQNGRPATYGARGWRCYLHFKDGCQKEQTLGSAAELSFALQQRKGRHSIERFGLPSLSERVEIKQSLLY